jgi:hypothetical protein
MLDYTFRMSFNVLSIPMETIHGASVVLATKRARKRMDKLKGLRKADKGQQRKSQSFAAAGDEKASASSEEGMSLPDSFIITAWEQLDDSLTSTMLNFTSEDSDADDTVVYQAYCMSVENSSADGIKTVLNHGKENESSSVNVLSPTLLPIGIMTVEIIQGRKVERPLKVLFDSGSMVTLVHSKVLLEDMESHVLSRPVSLYTVGDEVALERGVILQTIRVPELSPTRSFVNAVEALMCQETPDYDVILGIDVMGPA